MSFDLKTWAKNEGWATAGVSAPDIRPQSISQYEDWLKNFKGTGLTYLERRKLERTSPKDYFSEVKSILCFGLYYFPGWASGELKTSNYSWGKDYHDVLKQKLEISVQNLQKVLGPFSFRICVDTSPVLEKILAVQAGLGWQGKNTLVMNRESGSFLFLGEIFCDLDLSVFQASLQNPDRCGKCRRCIDACPTQALEPYVLKADRCISYWTLEHRGDFNSQTPDWKNWIAGCDICQEVCPWNQDLIPLPQPEIKVSVDEILSGAIQDQIKDSALSYVPEESWKRNLRHIDQAK